MKAKKALKRLAKAETLLSDVMEQYAKKQQRLRELLQSARDSVSRAKKTVSLRSSKPANKSVKADQPQRRRLSAASRRRLSVAAKKRWAARKGVQSVTDRSLIGAATA